jgi:hypothetical protein
LERAFLQGLKELGYIEGQNLVIESRVRQKNSAHGLAVFNQSV